MDDTLQELENELKALAPRRPAKELLARMEQDLGTAGSADTSARQLAPVITWSRFGWPLAAAAAVVLLVTFGVLRRQPSAPDQVQPAWEAPRLISSPVASQSRANTYHPVAATNVLYDMQVEPSTPATDDSSGRRVRYRYLDTYTWQNSATHASLKWSVPRDEVRVIPASFH